MLTESCRSDLLNKGFSRRDLGRMVSLLGAGAAISFFNEAALAQLSSLGKKLPPGSVKINANESPYGPSPAALEALTAVARDGGRYQYYETLELVDQIAELVGLEAENVIPYPGSSLGLHHSIMAFTSPSKGLVTVDPGYEAAARAAEYVGAAVTRVPLKPESGAHDIAAMLEAGSSAGLFYICNPNNPTGTVSPRKEIEYLVKNKPAGSVVLLDEAYIHFSDEPSGMDMVAAGDDVVVLRTFSKIYGMAGLRAGFAVGRPDLLARMRRFTAGALPVTAMAAAKVSLADKQLVADRKKLNASVRSGVFAFLEDHGYQVTPSVSCKFMVDTRRPVREVIRAMAEEEVFIGRPWPVWPTHARISVGNGEEMQRFKAAFLKAMERIPETGVLQSSRA